MISLKFAAAWVLLLSFGVFAGLQLTRPERVNARVDPARRLEAHVIVPPRVEAILDRSCRDCHSDQTRWPQFSRIAPASWLLAYHVSEARAHMNLSAWPDAASKQREALEDMCTQVRRGDMPLRLYRLANHEARLTSADADAICAWTAAAVQALPR